MFRDVVEEFEAMFQRDDVPTGTEVLVLAPKGQALTIELASEAAPLIAMSLRPERRHGSVLHIEEAPSDLAQGRDAFLAVVHDLGPVGHGVR